MAKYSIFDTTMTPNAPDSFTLNFTDDSKYGHKDFKLIDKNCRVAKEVSHALMFWNGEFCLNTDLGFDYKTFFELYQTNRKDIARAMVIELLQSVEDVLSVDFLEIEEDKRNRTLKINYILNTTYGIVRKGR